MDKEPKKAIWDSNASNIDRILTEIKRQKCAEVAFVTMRKASGARYLYASSDWIPDDAIDYNPRT